MNGQAARRTPPTFGEDGCKPYLRRHPGVVTTLVIIGLLALTGFLHAFASERARIRDLASEGEYVRVELRIMILEGENRDTDEKNGSKAKEIISLRSRLDTLRGAHDRVTARRLAEQRQADFLRREADLAQRELDERLAQEAQRKAEHEQEAERLNLETLAKTLAARCRQVGDKKIVDLTTNDTEFLRTQCGVTRLR
jgi:hypothetical protein